MKDNTKNKKVWLIIFLIIIVYSLYLGIFIRNTGFDLDGERYYCLTDDAMISMRYAKNLADGHGLVWNKGGERVEGYTNFLWVLFMAVFHVLPVPLSKTSLCIQASAAILLIINVLIIKKITEFILPDSFWLPVCAVIMTAFYFPLNYFSIIGMEISALTPLMSLIVLNVFHMYRENKFSTWCYILLGIGTLIRIDFIVAYLGLWFFLIVMHPEYRKKHIQWGTIIFLIFYGGQTLFRYLYFGELLPNTYFLKMTGFPALYRVTKGLYAYGNAIYGVTSFFILLAVGFLFVRRDFYILCLLWLFIIESVYSIYAGGDHWESLGWSNRFVIIVMPQFFILACYCLIQLYYFFIAHLDEKTRIRKALRYPVLVILFALILLHQNVINRLETLNTWLLLKPLELKELNTKMVSSAKRLTMLTTDDATIALAWAGVIPYFLDRSYIDLLGKNDKRIARMEVRLDSAAYKTWSKYFTFSPGHMKWDYHYSIGILKPDIVWQLWGSIEDAKPFLKDGYKRYMYRDHPFFTRSDSNKIHWHLLNR